MNNRNSVAQRLRKSRMIASLVVAMATLAFPPLAATPTAASPNQYGPPEWFPLRGTWVVGCTWNNGCGGGYHGYAALDLARNASGSIAGDPVYAAGAGLATVYSTGSTCGGPGTAANAVQVDHGNNIKSRYSHLGTVAIAAPTWVDQNTIIGHIGHTGYVDPCTFNHLHFEVLSNNTRVSPGPLKACHGSQLATYPAAFNGSPTDWNQVPLWTPLRSDSTECVASQPPASDGSVTLGSYDPTGAVFHERNSNTPGPADTPVQFGNANWVPLAGDWDGIDDGNREMTPGAYDPATGRFYLRNSNTPGPADTSFQYGNFGWIPIVGDWDGNGFWSIGLHDPGTGTFYLRNTNSAGSADYTFQFGNSGWMPIAGDWDGIDDSNSATTIGAYNPATATYYLNNENDSSAAESTLQYGNSGWMPIAGDWDGNQFASIGTYDPATAIFYLRVSNLPESEDTTTVQYGNAGWQPVVGNWNGQ